MTWGLTESWTLSSTFHEVSDTVIDSEAKKLRQLVLTGRIGLVEWCSEESAKALASREDLESMIASNVIDMITRKEEVA